MVDAPNSENEFNFPFKNSTHNLVRFQFTNQSKFYFLPWWFLFDPTVFKSSMMWFQFISFNFHVNFVGRFLIIWLVHSKLWLAGRIDQSESVLNANWAYAFPYYKLAEFWYCFHKICFVGRNLRITPICLFTVLSLNSWFKITLCLKSINKVQIVNCVSLHIRIPLFVGHINAGC